VRRSRPARALMVVLALLCSAGALYAVSSPRAGAQKGTSADPLPGSPPSPAEPGLTARGRSLFADGCSSCHGVDARGIRNLAPSLYGAGAAAADFYLSTGRMPLSNPRDEPTRSRPAYERPDIDALVAYVGSLGRGPAVPRVRPDEGRVDAGLHTFTVNCAGCHQVGAAGGIVTGGVAPRLDDPDVAPTQIGEAIRVGPFLMPAFNERHITEQDVNDLARYLALTQQPDDRGGWGIGHIGPIPEGMVAWLLAGSALLLVARLIGERNEA
jgi:ubiquinol-cytochrome c reductase cytochrome c subunit